MKDNSEVDIIKMTVTVKFGDNIEVLKIKRCEPDIRQRKRTAYTGPRDAII